MRARFRFRSVLITLAAIVGTATIALWFCWSRIEMWIADTHQQMVTKEIAQWEREYGVVTNLNQAVAAAEMLDYIACYYVPGGGYRGSPAVEAELQAQRASSMEAILRAVERFSTSNFGTNAAQWKQWAAAERERMKQAENSELDGAASQSHPVGSLVNGKSLPAGSGR